MALSSSQGISALQASDAAAGPLDYAVAERPCTGAPGEAMFDACATSDAPDDLSREVYGLLGLPIDAVDMETVVARIRAAAANATPFLLSTPNLEFVMIGRLNQEFRESTLLSDLCPADGMPIVWISRLLGIPLRERIAGADIFDALKTMRRPGASLSVFLFGGAEGVAAKASQRINAEAGAVNCIGWLYPGFHPIEDLCRADICNAINESKADFLAVALSAGKGQPWLLRNHHNLTIPVRASLGAMINFQAGTLARAPSLVRAYGLEWLWRIKEEPYLWTRYWRNLRLLLYLLPVCVLPLAVALWWRRWNPRSRDLLIRRRQEGPSIVISLSGAATGPTIGKAVTSFRNALAAERSITVDLSGIHAIDARFIGLLLMVRKQLRQQGLRLTLTGATWGTRLVLRLNGFDYLLASGNHGEE
jgi:N-acetylglucosaminyldiphosphoundecaprenol N-acetyl-beta-D-mannosaminyltransferase